MFIINEIKSYRRVVVIGLEECIKVLLNLFLFLYVINKIVCFFGFIFVSKRIVFISELKIKIK